MDAAWRSQRRGLRSFYELTRLTSKPTSGVSVVGGIPLFEVRCRAENHFRVAGERDEPPEAVVVKSKSALALLLVDQQKASPVRTNSRSFKAVRGD